MCCVLSTILSQKFAATDGRKIYGRVSCASVPVPVVNSGYLSCKAKWLTDAGVILIRQTTDTYDSSYQYSVGWYTAFSSLVQRYTVYTKILLCKSFKTGTRRQQIGCSTASYLTSFITHKYTAVEALCIRVLTRRTHDRF